MANASAANNETRPGEGSSEQHFNLLDEPWIPVIWRERPLEVANETSNHTPPRKRKHLDAHRSEIGILDALEFAADIRSLADSTPMVNLALLRFLMAVLYAAGVSRDDEASAWTPKLEAYLNKWRDRFWLYHPKHPFMQDAAKREKKPNKAVATLSHRLAQATNIAHFAHSRDGDFGLPVAECARALLIQTIAPTNSGSGFKACANGAPPVYVVPRADSLEMSIRKNLPHLLRSNSDAPSWESYESSSVTIGFLEGTTWQPRAVLLETPDANNLVHRMVYDQGRDADYVQSATREAKTEPAREWHDPHALPLKYPNPLEGNPAATASLRVLDGLTQHRPAAVEQLAVDHEVIPCDALFVSNDGKAKFYSTDAFRVDFPAAFLASAPNWQPIKKDYKYRLGSLFSKLWYIERLNDLDARQVGREIAAKVLEYEGADTTNMDRKARKAYEAERLSTLSEPLLRTRWPVGAKRSAEVFREMLSAASPSHPTSASNRREFIEALTNPRLFGPTELHRLRATPGESLERLVPLTDFLNDEIRNKKLLRGRERRWGWLAARLYAWHSHHRYGEAYGLSRCLAMVARRGCGRAFLERQLLSLAACPLEQTEAHMISVMQAVASLRTRNSRVYPVDFASLLDDLLCFEDDRISVVARWMETLRPISD